MLRVETDQRRRCCAFLCNPSEVEVRTRTFPVTLVGGGRMQLSCAWAHMNEQGELTALFSALSC